ASLTATWATVTGHKGNPARSPARTSIAVPRTEAPYCRAAAMPNGRCKVHGGKSTGPRTPEGLERSRRANWKHGHYSREAKAERSRVRAAHVGSLGYGMYVRIHRTCILVTDPTMEAWYHLSIP